MSINQNRIIRFLIHLYNISVNSNANYISKMLFSSFNYVKKKVLFYKYSTMEYFAIFCVLLYCQNLNINRLSKQTLSVDF